MKHIKQILQVLGLILCIYAYSLIHIDIENYVHCLIPETIAKVLSFLWAHLWIERIISISLAICTAIIIRKIHRLAYISFELINLPLILFWIVCFSIPRWEQVNSGLFNIPFALILVFLFFLCWLSCVAQFLYIFEQNQVEKNTSIPQCGFLQSNRVVNLTSIRKSFAYMIVDRLVNTHNDKESFAIVIYGSWGSGKTVFLENIRCLLHDKKQVVIEFNPWRCNSVAQIRKDFLEVIRLQLKQYDFSLARFFYRYSNLLSSFDTPKTFKEFVSFIIPKNDTVSEVKEHIILSLQKIKKPLYVLIDDLDRLDSDEIMEVLKLIRNTANFPYLKFVVACDRKYVIEQLRSRGINAKYLEKIFMVDFHLPQVYVDNPCTCILEKDINLLTKNNRILHTFNSLNFSQKTLLDKCLGSFRQAKRFAGQIVVAMEFAENYVYNQKINVLLSELLWVELLKFIDIDVYSNLKESPTAYLDMHKKGIDKYGLQYYSLKKSYKDIPIIDQEILEQIFPVKDGALRSVNSIAYLENFDKYFSYGISARHISESAFFDVLYRDEDLNTIYEEFIRWKGNKLLQSLGNRILMTNTYVFNLNVALRFIYLLFLIIENCKEDFYIQLISSKLMQDDYRISIRRQLATKIISILNSPAIVRLSPLSISAFLHEMYVLCKKHRTLLSKSQLDKVIRNNLSNYIKRNEVDASDVIDNQSELYDIVKQSCITTPILDERDDIDHIEYNSLVFDILLDYFSKHKSENIQAIKDFEDLWLNNTTGAYYDIEFADQNKDNEIGSLFGNSKNYSLFKKECFSWK